MYSGLAQARPELNRIPDNIYNIIIRAFYMHIQNFYSVVMTCFFSLMINVLAYTVHYVHLVASSYHSNNIIFTPLIQGEHKVVEGH